MSFLNIKWLLRIEIAQCNNHLTTTCKYAAADIINISFMNASSLHPGPNQILIPKAFSDMKFWY